MKSNENKVKLKKWKKNKAENIKDIDWKETLFKSVIYRIITVILGFTTTYIITGNAAISLGIASLTEIVQFINYFVFDLAWTNLRTKKRFEKKFLKRSIELKIHYDSVLDLAYEISKIDTFIKEVYESGLNFFKSVLKNDQLSDYHDEILKYF